MNAVIHRWLAACGGALITLAVSACGSSSSVAPVGTSSGGSSGGAAVDERDCLWALDSNAVNTLFPDSHANYWLAVLPIPPGGDIRLDGVFPHARYISFNLYNAELQPVDALNDTLIQPDAGATNPFAAGAERNAAARGYSLHIVAAAPPATRAANTLYNAYTLGSATVPVNLAVLVYRVYVPDHGLDSAGGTGLPHISFENPGGVNVSGLQACKLPAVLDSVLPNLANIPDLLADVPLNTSAFGNLLWLKFFDLQSSEANRVYNTPLGPAVYELLGSPTSGGGGFLSNQDNRYIYASISQQLGDVVALHATLPATPTTSNGASTMGSGDMRYWSVCSNDGNTLVVFDCLYDEQVVRDAQGRGVVLVSKPADRPANATAQCGVSWLDWGASNTGVLIWRNMLPQPQDRFPYAVQYVPGPPGQHEAEVMGKYFPYGTHMSKAAFEALGCPVSADALPSVVTPPP